MQCITQFSCVHTFKAHELLMSRRSHLGFAWTRTVGFRKLPTRCWPKYQHTLRFQFPSHRASKNSKWRHESPWHRNASRSPRKKNNLSSKRIKHSEIAPSVPTGCHWIKVDQLKSRSSIVRPSSSPSSFSSRSHVTDVWKFHFARSG